MTAALAGHVEVNPVLPRVWDDLWKTHGPAIRAAQDAATHAQAALVDAAGPGWPG